MGGAQRYIRDGAEFQRYLTQRKRIVIPQRKVIIIIPKQNGIDTITEYNGRRELIGFNNENELNRFIEEEFIGEQMDKFLTEHILQAKHAYTKE